MLLRSAQRTMQLHIWIEGRWLVCCPQVVYINLDMKLPGEHDPQGHAAARQRTEEGRALLSSLFQASGLPCRLEHKWPPYCIEDWPGSE